MPRPTLFFSGRLGLVYIRTLAALFLFLRVIICVLYLGTIHWFSIEFGDFPGSFKRWRAVLPSPPQPLISFVKASRADIV